MKNNITLYYGFCYAENNAYCIDVEEGDEIQKYIVDDCVENIKYDKFFLQFIEINAISIIFSKVIVILDNINFNKYWRDCSILAAFGETEKEIFNVNEIMCINYVSKNHYQILKMQ